MSFRYLSAFSLLLFCCLGCTGRDQPPVAEVQGVITYEGKPLPSANVIFQPESGPVASGLTDESGRFSLITQGQKGALLGNHKVSIQAMEPAKGKATAPITADGQEVAVEMVSKIPAQYSSFHHSGLTAHVEKKSVNEINFDLK